MKILILVYIIGEAVRKASITGSGPIIGKLFLLLIYSFNYLLTRVLKGEVRKASITGPIVDTNYTPILPTVELPSKPGDFGHVESFQVSGISY